MFETSQVECAKGAVGADRDEDVCGAGEPGDVVHLAIVSDELCDCRGRVDIPDGASRVDRGRNDETWRLLIPREARQGCTGVVVLDFALLRGDDGQNTKLRGWMSRRPDGRSRDITS